MTEDFPHASVVEGVRFTAQVGAPQLLSGQFTKRVPVARALGAIGADRAAYEFVEALVRKYGPAPFYVRLALDEVLLVHHPDDLRFVLDNSPQLFASDPDTKRKGMVAFQPDALTLSRTDLWADRRQFAEAVLDTDRPLHRLAERFRDIAAAEADALGVSLEWNAFHAAFQRMTRRIVFGDSAADDTELMDSLEELMSKANGMPGEQEPEYADFVGRIAALVDSAEPGSLASLFGNAPVTDRTRPAGQVVHWLFAMGNTLPINSYRALAVLAAQPEHLRAVRGEMAEADLDSASGTGSLTYLAGCISEAMRLWPTTPLLARVALEDARFPDGRVLAEGKQVVIFNGFNHRNRGRIPYADEFAPREWVSGSAGEERSFNFFSSGPQVCPAAGLAVYLGQAFLARLLLRGEPRLRGADLASQTMPYSLDVYGVDVAFESVAATPTADRK